MASQQCIIRSTRHAHCTTVSRHRPPAPSIATEESCTLAQGLPVLLEAAVKPLGTSSSAGLSRQYILDCVLSTSWHPWSNQQMCYVAGRRFDLDVAITEQPLLHSEGDLSRLRLGGADYRQHFQSHHAIRLAIEPHNSCEFEFRGVE